MPDVIDFEFVCDSVEKLGEGAYYGIPYVPLNPEPVPPADTTPEYAQFETIADTLYD